MPGPRGTPARCSTSLAPWAVSGSSRAPFPKAPSATTSVGWPLLGRYGEADDYFAKAAASNARAGAKFFAARTELPGAGCSLSVMPLVTGKEARRLLTQAHTAAAAHGYRWCSDVLRRLFKP